MECCHFLVHLFCYLKYSHQRFPVLQKLKLPINHFYQLVTAKAYNKHARLIDSFVQDDGPMLNIWPRGSSQIVWKMAEIPKYSAPHQEIPLIEVFYF